MSLRIFHRNVYLLILVLTLLVCLGVGTSYGNANALAEKVYTKHRTVFERDDVQDALPAILEQLGTPAVQKLLTPVSIPLVVKNPDLLKPAVPDASPEFIASMKEEAELQKLLQDADFQKLMQNPAAIDVLVTLIRGADGPPLTLDGVRIQAFTSALELPMRTFELTSESFTIGDTFQIDTTHKFVFTATSANGDPVPWLPIRFDAVYMDGTAADLTFAPATAKTNQNGKVPTDITFRGDPGDIRLIAEIDRSQIVVFLEPELARNGSSVADVAVRGIEQGFAGLGTNRTLVFTATDESRNPISGIALTFRFQSDAARQATATFFPSTATTDENGTVQTRVTFGIIPGDLRIEVFEPVITWISTEDLASNGRLGFERLESDNDDIIPGGRQKFVFIATDPNTRQPLSGYPLELRVDPTSEATATLNPSQIEFDENGKAEIQIINGPQGGRLKIIATLKSFPLYLKALNYTFSDEVGPNVEVTMFYGGTTPKAHSPIEVGDELRSQFQTGTDFLNVYFAVKKNGISMPNVELVVTATSDKPSVTFRPSTINMNRSISTLITVGKDVRELSIQVKVRLQGHLRIKSLGKSIGDYVITYNIAGSEIAAGQQYPVGSKHKVMVTVTKDGKTVPDATVTSKATSHSTLESIASKSLPTATFDPAEVITDENGEAETYLTFGDVPGDLRLDFVFGVDIPKITYTQGGPGVTFSLISYENADKTDDVDWSDLNTWTSIPFGESRSVRVAVLNSDETAVITNADLILSVDSDSQGSATFRGKTQLHAQVDKRGESFFTITFGEQRGDIHINIKLNMVYASVRIHPDEKDTHVLMNPGYTFYELYKAERQQPDIETDTAVFDEEGIQRSDTASGESRIMSYARLENGNINYHPVPSRSYDRLYLHLPLDTSNALTFYVHEEERFITVLDITAKVRMVPQGSIYTLWEKRGLESFQLHNDYAINENGGFSFRFDTGSTPGYVELVFGPPVVGGAILKGRITVFGEDDDGLFGMDPFRNELNIASDHISSQDNFSQFIKGTFRFHGEIRLEVYIKTRRIKTSGVEIGAYVKFFEFDRFVGGENDLDGVSFLTFTLPWKTPWPHRQLLHIGQLQGRESDYDRSLKRLADESLLPPLIDVDASAQRSLISPESSYGERIMELEHLRRQVTPERGNDDWANVYLDLEVTPTEFTPVFAAPSERTMSPFSISDVNVDGQVNVMDLMLVSNALEQTDLTNLRMDVDSDGIFTIADLLQVAAHLGKSIGSQTPAALVVPKQLTYATVEVWIDQARAADDGSRVFKYGIANLQQLLTRIIPEDTALLANYPNPFNPETWIPYQLAKPAEVTVSIHSADGRLVRTLALGQLPAGAYQDKDRAAYWEGRNEQGEAVASGVYFYTLKAGEFSATKKMLIRK